MWRFVVLVMLLVLVDWGLPVSGVAGAAVGIYGVTKDWQEGAERPVGRVFLPPNRELVKQHRQAGREVFLSLNVFGGRQAWEEFPDSVPVLADGRRLVDVDNHGGICPTHPQWRAGRLARLAELAQDFGGEEGITGIWLDFIRYPGRWEQVEPAIPDTCYCPRCLALFQQDTDSALPGDLLSDGGAAAAWLQQHEPLAWVRWKKQQVTSFVAEARAVLTGARAGVRPPVQLGVFLVPWRLSDYDGGVTRLLGQDPAQLAPLVDWLSPMVYHRMVGRQPDWIAEMSRYYRDIAPGRVWPIIQAQEVPTTEFSRAVAAAVSGGADGLLVYNYRSLTSEQWPLLADFAPSVNLIEHATLLPGQEADGDGPAGWQPDARLAGQETAFHYVRDPGRGGPAIGVTTGADHRGAWSTGLPPCVAGAEYLFTGDFFRYDRVDPHAYPELSLWGQTVRLNTHRMFNAYQRLPALVRCPEDGGVGEPWLRFGVTAPEATFWLKEPRLERRHEPRQSTWAPPASDFFPLGVYGARTETLDQVKQLGLNSAVVGLNEQHLAACRDSGVHCLLSVPRDPERLLVELDRLAEQLRGGAFSFYVNDEPEIHSFPLSRAEDIQRILNERFPEHTTAMAIVRPQGVQTYRDGADYFMLDQYPVPNMPLSWQADALDEAAAAVGPERLQAVIQAFGGGRYADSGWPRRPTFAEMNCLAFLAVIHGARGLYFYTLPAITDDAAGHDDFARLISRLNSLQSWLAATNDPTAPEVTMVSRYQVDPAGNAAVHCATKTRHNTRLLICANTLATAVTADITPPPDSASLWQSYFTSSTLPVVNNTLRHRFAPHEVAIWLEDGGRP